MPQPWEKYRETDQIGYYVTPSLKNAPGLIKQGNIDLTSRPITINPDGSKSTVYSMGFDSDDGYVVVPGVALDGARQLSPDEAWQQYQKTGKHLGIFKNRTSGDVYSGKLHEDYQSGKIPIKQQAGPWNKYSDQTQAKPLEEKRFISKPPRYGTGLYETTIGPLKDLYAHHQENVKQLTAQYGAIGNSLATFKTMYDLGKGLIKGSNEQAVEALTELGRGDIGEFIRHAPGIVPGIGPAAVQVSETAETQPERALGQASGLIGTAILAPEVPKIIKGTVRAGKTATIETLGKTTGVGGKAIRQALEKPTPELTEAMRGGITETELVNNFKEAMQNVKQARSEAYQQKLASLPMTGPGTSLDISPIQNNLKIQLKKFNIKADPSGELDFSRSTIRDSAAQNDVKAIYNDVMGWGTKQGDRTPAGVDILKRRIDDTYSPSSTARSIVQSVKNTTRNLLNEKVPGYSQMTADYAKASRFVDALSDLSLEGKNPGVAIRKITTLLNQNNNYRQLLAEKLSQYTVHDLEGQLAGLNLSRWSPRGIMGPASGIGLVYGVATEALTPIAAVSLAMTSPRLVGELLTVISKIPKVTRMLKIPEIPTVAAQGLRIGAILRPDIAGRQAESRTSE